MKKRAKQILGWCHGGILLSVLAPVLYGMAIQGDAAYHMERVWLLNLPILAVIVGTDLLVERCQKIGAYLFGAVLCVVLVNFIAWQIHGFAGERTTMDMGVGAVVILALESMAVLVERILIRLHDKRNVDRREENPDWQPRQSILTHPALHYVLVLLFAYGVGKYCNNPHLCNIALGLTALYLCIVILYLYLDRTEEYLFLNKRVCNLSQKRLYGINGSICLLFVSGVVCMGILSGVTAGNRTYTDIRELLKVQLDPYVMTPEEFFAEYSLGSAGEEWQYFMDVETGEPPAWMEILEKAIAVATLFTVAGLGIYGLRRIGSLFRETFDENGDVVEDLGMEEDVAERVESAPVFAKRLTEAEQIRRQYRRTIKKYRRERPGCHETPYEIETGAGIADTEQMQSLHEAYERARYHV